MMETEKSDTAGSISQADEADLEDGEIDESDEDVAIIEAPPMPKVEEPPKKAPEQSSSSNISKREKRKRDHQDRSDRKSSKNKIIIEDDFASTIEKQIASMLKKNGVEPPQPNIKKSDPEVIVIDDADDRKKDDRYSKRQGNKRKQKSHDKQKKKSKLDNDGYYMVGGSPSRENSAHSEDSETTHSSYDSDAYHRTSYDDRRHKRKDKYSNDRNSRGSKSNRRDQRDLREEKELCLKFSEHGSCPDGDNCTRLHEVRPPKKMELCKFYLMECCAKRDKCSYMHGDFPCKYYYLGLKCQNKDCKFNHGKPLTDALKNILQKHLETAPKEILGDFPRISRDHAQGMITATHIKLLAEFGMDVPVTPKIPSLLDMVTTKPPELNEKGKKSSRWVQKPETWSHPPPDLNVAPKCDGVSLRTLVGTLTIKQIDDLDALGIKTVNQINHLTVAQLNELGLTVTQISEIQLNGLNALNAQKQDKLKKPEEPKFDIDLRVPPPVLPNISLPPPPIHEDSSSNQDIDMRITPGAISTKLQAEISSPDHNTIMSPTNSIDEARDNYLTIAKTLSTSVVTQSSLMPTLSMSDQQQTTLVVETPENSTPAVSNPAIVDYSQYLRDSNLNSDDQNEDEPDLEIDETYGQSEEEKKETDDSASEEEALQPTNPFSYSLLPPSITTSNFLPPAAPKVDISSTISQLLDEARNKEEKPVDEISPQRSRDPRTALVFSSLKKSVPPGMKSPEISKKEIKRTSIYESETIESPSEDEDVIKIDKDKDMRMPFLRDSENGDIDLRFPFSPLSSYVPATEIDGSFGSHTLIKWDVKIVEIPKPDYSEIRRNFKQSESLDPRLKKICGILDASEDKKPISSLPNTPVSPQLDPRKRNLAPAAPIQPAKMEIKNILQNSEWYKNLSSSQKMMVNQLLSELSIELKRFHSDPTPTKMFDVTFFSQRTLLQQVMTNLGVFINMKGEFEEFNEIASFPSHPMPTLAQMQLQPPPGNHINMANISNLPNMTAPPMLTPQVWSNPRFLNELRPGILGMAPNIAAQNIRPFNYDPMQPNIQNMQNMQNMQNFGGNQDFCGNQTMSNLQQNLQNMSSMSYNGQNNRNNHSNNNNNNNSNSRGSNSSNNNYRQGNQGSRDHQREHQNPWRNNNNSMNNRSRNNRD